MSTTSTIGETISQQFTPTTLFVSSITLILFLALYIFSVKREKRKLQAMVSGKIDVTHTHTHTHRPMFTQILHLHKCMPTQALHIFAQCCTCMSIHCTKANSTHIYSTTAPNAEEQRAKCLIPTHIYSTTAPNAEEQRAKSLILTLHTPELLFPLSLLPTPTPHAQYRLTLIVMLWQQPPCGILFPAIISMHTISC